jgi:hypothetical protein
MMSASKTVHVRPLNRQSVTDGFREMRIQELQEDLNAAQNYALKRSIWETLRAEINARSPEQVRVMELELGLS